MQFRTLFLVAAFVLAQAADVSGQAQNIRITDSLAREVVLGNFSPADFATAPRLETSDLASVLEAELQADSLRSYLFEMNAFGNRNTGSDTSSTTFGMGAARRWAHARMEGFAASTNGRLQVGYLQFDQLICDMQQHRNVLAVLPGTGPRAQELIIIEGHLDSRCAERCDVDCPADSMEDNASGSALVLELARVMSQYAFDQTFVFMLTTGEEQGLLGAQAFADYCEANEIEIEAVLNNDVIGGVICGQTASPPGCPGLNEIDSTNVRIYSGGTARALARYTAYVYNEFAAPVLANPSVINLMELEDRTGRGGDHIPFRRAGYRAIRFTSANEHGDANTADPDYDDRQHTSDDVLGVDTDNDGELDSFFVDFRYLYKNALINATTAAYLSNASVRPERIDLEVLDYRMAIEVVDPLGRDSFLLGARLSGASWDTLYRVAAVDTIACSSTGRWFVSAAFLGEEGLPSQWTEEASGRIRQTSSSTDLLPLEPIELLPNVPNPFDEATLIRIMVNTVSPTTQGYIVVHDRLGKQLAELPISLQPGLQEVAYDFRHHNYVEGTYSYSLVIDGRIIATRQMIYAY